MYSPGPTCKIHQRLMALTSIRISWVMTADRPFCPKDSGRSRPTGARSLSRIRGVVANYLASQVRDPGIDSHQHLKDSWHIWRHLRRDTVFSCNLRFRLIFLHGCSRTHCVASLRAVPVGRISYNLYFDCKHVRSVTCDLINERIYYYKSTLRMKMPTALISADETVKWW